MVETITRLLDLNRNISYWRTHQHLTVYYHLPSEKYAKLLDQIVTAKSRLSCSNLEDTISIILQKEWQETHEKEFDKFLKQQEKKSTTVSKDMAIEHLKFLEFVFATEKKRQERIDQKSQSIIAQTALMAAIMSLLIPFFFDRAPKACTLEFLFFILPFLFFMVTCFFLAKTIILGAEATKPVHYDRPAESLILHHSGKDVYDFQTSISSQLYAAIQANVKTNSERSTKVQRALNNLIVSVMFALIFIMGHSLNVIFNNGLNKTQDVKIVNETKSIDDSMKTIGKSISNIEQSLKEKRD